MKQLYMYVRRMCVNYHYKSSAQYRNKINNNIKLYLIVRKGFTELTAYRAMNDVKHFYEKTNTIVPTESDVLSCINDMKLHPYSYSSIRNTLGSLKQLMFFWGLAAPDIRLKKPEKLVKDFLTEQEIQKMIKANTVVKEKALLSLLSYTGIRFSELRNLQVAHIRFSELCVFVEQGKNHRDRIVCITSACAELLQKHITIAKKKQSDYVFGDSTNRKVSSKILRRIFRQTQKKAHVKKHVYAHLFRHSLATNLLLKGADLVSVQRQLGHKNISTTLTYINFTPELFRMQYEKYVPNYIL